MRDRNAFVTRDIRGESQHPVPSRPYPTRPALYREPVETSIHSSSSVIAESRVEWMEEVDLNAEVPCEGLWADDEGCPRRRMADLLVRSHTWPSAIPTCKACWNDAGAWGNCPIVGCGTRDQHFHIIEVFR